MKLFETFNLSIGKYSRTRTQEFFIKKDGELTDEDCPNTVKTLKFSVNQYRELRRDKHGVPAGADMECIDVREFLHLVSLWYKKPLFINENSLNSSSDQFPVKLLNEELGIVEGGVCFYDKQMKPIEIEKFDRFGQSKLYLTGTTAFTTESVFYDVTDVITDGYKDTYLKNKTGEYILPGGFVSKTPPVAGSNDYYLTSFGVYNSRNGGVVYNLSKEGIKFIETLKNGGFEELEIVHNPTGLDINVLYNVTGQKQWLEKIKINGVLYTFLDNNLRLNEAITDIVSVKDGFIHFEKNEEAENERLLVQAKIAELKKQYTDKYKNPWIKKAVII